MENLKKYTSTVENSPFLDGDEVDIKAYSNVFSGEQQTPPQQPQPPVTEQKTQQQQQFAEKPPQNEQHFTEQQATQQPYNEYANDNIDPMSFGEPGRFNETPQEEEGLSAKADKNSDFLLTMYNVYVPKIIGKKIEINVPSVKSVLETNKNVPKQDLNGLIKFLNESNVNINEALMLDPGEAEMLKDAFGKVIDRYGIGPTHPLINLVTVVGSIGFMKYITIKNITDERNTMMMQFMEQFKVTVPEGTAHVFKGSKKKLIRKMQEQKQAA